MLAASPEGGMSDGAAAGLLGGVVGVNR